MSVVSVKARSFILALFIRDDGERFLLGDNGYDFKDSQLHFAANTIENDEVMKQGADGVMVAGQVRRASVQSFDGFVGDATMAKETIEQMRRDFFAFFIKGHHFRVVYIDCNRNAWQRKGGYLVDAPEVKELWQIHPEYHVGLNFEDVNYYSYDEDADGNEILANLVNVPVSTEIEGGLVWDEDGAVSEDASDIYYDTATATATPGKIVNITDATEAPIASFQLNGETSQNGTPTPEEPVPIQTVTGRQVVKVEGKNLLPNRMTSGTIAGAVQNTVNSDGSFTLNGTSTTGSNVDYNNEAGYYVHLEQGQKYTLSVNNSGLYWRIRKIATSTLIAQIDSPATSVTFTANTTEDAFLYFVVLNNSSFSNANFKVQLEQGSTATAYEPYQEQRYDINLVSATKNLFDKKSADIGYRIGANGSRIAAEGYFLSAFIPIEPNTQYVISPSSYLGSSAIATYKADKTLLRRLTGASFSSITTESDAAYIRFATDINSIDTTQLERGTTATVYEAFSPLELCKMREDYQDYIYKSEDAWYKHTTIGKAIFNGSEGWSIAGSGTQNYYYALANAAPGTLTQDNATRSFSNYERAGAVYSTNTNQGIFILSSGQVRVRSGAEITVANWKSKLSTTPMVLYYPLATPTDTEITNEALIEQLEAILSQGSTYAGTNNITTVISAGNEQGELEISYYTKYQPMVGSGGYVWEAGGAGGATIVVNNSIDSVNPIWKIYGPTMNPQLENSTTGEVIEYVGMIAEGQTLTIDMGEQTASLDGLNVISNLVGDFISLVPGANRLIYSVSGDAGASEIGWSEIVG